MELGPRAIGSGISSISSQVSGYDRCLPLLQKGDLRRDASVSILAALSPFVYFCCPEVPNCTAEAIADVMHMRV